VADVLIIGAGSSGLAAGGALARRGIDFEIVEKGSRVGGNWVYENDNGLSPTYASVHTNTSRKMTSFSDYPIPKEMGHYPHHSDMARYLDGYADHAGLRDRIRFRTAVERAEPVEGGWRVRLSDGEESVYKQVIVAIGHHWDQRWPDVPGEFAGGVRHAASYRTPEPFAGRRVLVVGFGNAALEIAAEVSDVAEAVFLSFRRTLHVFPRYMLKVPTDHIESDFSTRWFPWFVRRTTTAVSLRMLGPRLPVPRPDHRVLEGHPSVCGEIIGPKVRDGSVRTKPALARLDGDSAVFADDSSERVDEIVYATGYHISFPFLPQERLRGIAKDRMPLYRRIVHPSLPGVYFIGIMNAIGGLIPVVEAQAEWVADVLEGHVEVPSPGEMEAAIARDDEGVRHRFGGSEPNDTILCDRLVYTQFLERERRRGTRARRLMPAR
jgi:dimethylaniline monooxygenase (N-oxide forming)